MQPAVEEQLRQGQDDRAVDVVLDLQVSFVADADRSHAAIAGQAVDLGFAEPCLGHDAVDRLQRAVGRAGDDIGDVVEEILHRPRRAKPVERVDDEIGVPQPTEAIVPVAAGILGLGDRCGYRRDDGTGLLKTAQLQCDGRADDFGLPFERNRQIACPLPPVAACAFVEFAGGLLHRRGEALVGPEQQRDRVLADEHHLFGDERRGRIGRQPQRAPRHDVADVIGPASDLRSMGAVVEGGLQPDADPRRAIEGLDVADHRQWAEDTVVLAVAGREVRDLDAMAVPVEQPGHQDRGVVHVALFAALEIQQLNVVEAAVGVLGDRLQQAAEYRVAVEAGRATPGDPPPGIDEGRESAVADNSKVEVGDILWRAGGAGFGACFGSLAVHVCSSSSERAASQATSSATPAHCQCACEAGRSGGVGPTRIETPAR